MSKRKKTFKVIKPVSKIMPKMLKGLFIQKGISFSEVISRARFARLLERDRKYVS